MFDISTDFYSALADFIAAFICSVGGDVNNALRGKLTSGGRMAR